MIIKCFCWVFFFLSSPSEKLRKTGRRNTMLPSWSRAGSEPARCGPTSGTVCVFLCLSVSSESIRRKEWFWKTYREKKTLKNKITGLNNLFSNFRPAFLPSKGSLDTSAVPIIILDLCKWPAGINVAFALPPPIPLCTHTHTHTCTEREMNTSIHAPAPMLWPECHSAGSADKLPDSRLIQITLVNWSMR